VKNPVLLHGAFRLFHEHAVPRFAKNPDTFSLFPSKILNGKPGESKSGTVYLGRIIPEFFKCSCPFFVKLLQRVPFQGTKKETDHAAGVSGNHGVIIACLWKKLAGEVIDSLNDVSVEEEGLALSDDDALIGESFLHIRVKLSLEKDLAWTHGVSGIDYDHFIGLVATRDELGAVLIEYLDFRIIKRRSKRREVLAADINDTLVDFTKVDRFHFGMFESFPHHPSIPTADNEHS
jgi:hypothetical protein